jgi:hypothetical protein
MATIRNGSIEAVTPDGQNFGVPITPLNPFDTTKAAAQIKARTGVTVGDQLSALQDDSGAVLQGFNGRWSGTTTSVGDVEVRVWETAE